MPLSTNETRPLNPLTATYCIINKFMVLATFEVQCRKFISFEILVMMTMTMA